MDRNNSRGMGLMGLNSDSQHLTCEARLGNMGLSHESIRCRSRLTEEDMEGI